MTVGPNGQGNSATITDLTTGITVPLNPNEIRVAGPTVRVLVSASQLPSEGFALKNYKFAVFTQLAPTTNFSLIGSFVPESTMIPIEQCRDERGTNNAVKKVSGNRNLHGPLVLRQSRMLYSDKDRQLPLTGPPSAVEEVCEGKDEAR